MATDTDPQEWHAACARLGRRFDRVSDDERSDTRQGQEPGTAVQAVALAIEAGRPVDVDDTRAGLLLIPRARDALYACEHILMRYARGCGLTWEEIGQLLGVGDRRAAQARYQRLTKRRGDVA